MKTSRFIAFVSVAAVLFSSMPELSHAMPARRFGEIKPIDREKCEQPVRRFLGGRGSRRAPGVIPVLVTIRQEIRDKNKWFISASADETIAEVHGDEVHLRITVSNRSIYAVGGVVLDADFTPAEGGMRPLSIFGVTGARFDTGKRQFVIPRIEGGEHQEISYRMQFPGDIEDGVYQQKVTVRDFQVLENSRRFPPLTAESSDASNRVVTERVGLGGSDVSCFTGSDEFMFEFPPRLARTSPRIMDSTLAGLTVEKTASAAEALPGSDIWFTVLVTNNTNQTITDITVDDRFPTSLLQMKDAGGGHILGGGLQWFIPVLAPGAQWVTHYSATVSPNARGQFIASTVTVVSPDLLGTAAAGRSASLRLAVLGALPATGGSLLWVQLLALLGIGVVMQRVGILSLKR